MESRKKIVDIVVPCFNEAHNLPELFKEFETLRTVCIDTDFNLIIIDNGSTDDTAKIAKEFVGRCSGSTYLLLSRNFGKEASLTAGIEASKGDACIPMDADLQDPMTLIPEMVNIWENGADVVLARRSSRAGDKKNRIIFSRLYLKFFNHLSDTKIVPSVGEFRLMDQSVVNAFKSLSENQRFVRGLFAWLGFREVIIDFERPAREKGQSSFSFGRLVNLGADGLTSFTTMPLRLATILGVTVTMLTMVCALVIFTLAIFGKIDVPGYASLIIVVLILGGLQLLFLGILGEYVGKILLESKKRPLYIVKERVANDGT